MSQEAPVGDAFTPEKLSKLLAEATGTTPETIEQGAEAIEIAPPDEVAVDRATREGAIRLTNTDLKNPF
jgi:hypothetical protein